MITSPKTPLKDLKEGLSSTRKPDLTHVRSGFATYVSRPAAFGSRKYQRANYLRAVSPGGHTGVPTREDFERLREYLRANLSHVMQVLDSMEMHQSTDPELEDVEGMTRAVYAPDVDEDTTGRVGPSFLPHIAPACTSLMMAVEQAILCGLLPRDPGQPWEDAECASPMAEEARAKHREHSTKAALKTRKRSA